MSSKFGITFAFLLIITTVAAQNLEIDRKEYDSLLKELKNSKEDTTRINILGDIAWTWKSNKDSSLSYYNQAINLAHQAGYFDKEAALKNMLGNLYWNMANYPAALENYMQALRYYEKVNNIEGVKTIYSNFGNIYYALGNYRKSLDYSFQGLRNSRTRCGFEFCTIAKAYLELGIPDSALYFCEQSLDISKEINDDFNVARSLQTFGDIELKKENFQEALKHYREGLTYSHKIGWQLGSAELTTAIAKIFYLTGAQDSAIYYSTEALQIARGGKALGVVIDASILLHDIYKPLDQQLSLQYLDQAYVSKDSLFNNQKINALQNFAQSEEARQKDKRAVELEYRNNLVFYGLVSGLTVIALIAFILFRTNNQRKAANLLLTQQKQKLEITLTELKSAQAQLIQSEKMASLGELTAGIAHEIQNPLNFVNNFSEVSTELIDEMKNELATGNHQLATEIATDLKHNLEKISHHGKRAEAIVKGMLQHSNKGTGAKEPTDINALCDEYLRLAYHGMRAKDKSFNAKFETSFDTSLPKINIVPQDIGRVVLNLINNAFYAVQQGTTGNEHPDPLVKVSTKNLADKIEISVSDNGQGIPENIKDKIFQPFFTTKPTGQGTGLGLSLSYDIVKAHGGELKVSTSVSEGTTFTISIPALERAS